MNVDRKPNLNPAQKEAVEHTSGPILVLAGAGAGKTKVLVSRIINLIENGVSPENILAITFTNKAAGEMRERVLSSIENNTHINRPAFGSYYDKKIPFVSTFHSLGVHILRADGTKIGIPRTFKIYDRSDGVSAIREAMKKLGISTKEWSPSKIQSIISKQKGDNLDPNRYEIDNGNPAVARIVSPVWKEYELILKRERSLDFDDLLLKTLHLLEDQETREKYQNQWSHLHIDEYQDTNAVQYEIAMRLVGKDRNIFVVGDGDQNIYSWRGADMKNILGFEDDFPNSKVVLLEKNYRSTKNILRAAQDVIEKNTMRKDKTLFTDNEDGEKISVIYAYDEADEARNVAEKITELKNSGTKLKDIAILYRTNFQSRALEEAMISHDIPYHLLGTRFFERKEIKDILSYIRLGVDPESVADIRRVINVPRRGIGKVTLAKVVAGKTATLSHKVRAEVESFNRIIAKIKSQIGILKPSEFVAFVYENSGIKNELEKFGLKKDEEEKERIQNIGELITLATKYDAMSPEEGVVRLLDDVALASDQDSLEGAKNGVRLMTIHASKGLEFDVVFITGLEEGLFPQTRDGVSLEEEEEERRLCYVAITRAKKKVFLTQAAMRTIFGSRTYSMPSRFLDDISEDVIDTGESKPIKTIYLD